MIRWFLALGVLSGFLAAASLAHADELSGTWAAKGPTMAVMIQFVAAEGGNLSGRYEQVVLQSDGTLARLDAAITGATDGHTAVLTIKPAAAFSGEFVASSQISIKKTNSL